MFKSKVLSRKSKITLYKALVRPVVALYACNAWATTKSDELKLAIFERKILRRIYGPKKNNGGKYETRTNQEIKDLHGEATIDGVLKSNRLKWAGQPCGDQ